MDFASLHTTLAGITGAAAAAAFVGWLIWWLVRQRQNRVWLPTIRVLEIESHLLPKLQWQPPPLIPFLAFFVASLAVIWFAMSPTKKWFSSFEPNEARYHIYLDMSPSVSAHVSLPTYGSQFLDLWGTLSKGGRVSVSSSLSTDFVTPRSLGEAKAYFEQLSFHRAGIRLGSALHEQMEELGKIDRLFIISDADQHSWSDLNWEFLSNELDVIMVDVRDGDVEPNLYIDNVTYASTPGAETLDWEVELVRTDAEVENKGVVTVQMDDEKLATSDYTIPQGRTRHVVRLRWLALDQENAEKADKDNGRMLMFRVTPVQPDAVQLDNQFRTQARGRKQNGLLVAAPAGEMQLEDPTHHLQKSLQVLDFRLKRVDKLVQPGPVATAYPFWLLVGGAGDGIDRFCPRSIETARLERISSQGAKSAESPSLPTVWLMPQHPNADYRELCWCYARLAVSQAPLQEEPGFCRDVITRERFIGVLDSLGAVQVGGKMDDITGALALRSFDSDSGLQVVAFTVPLTPMRATGISHAALPVMTKSLLEFQGLITESSGRAKEAWPRVPDLAAIRAKRIDPAMWQRIQASNVPAGESMIQAVESGNLPPRWMAGGESSQKQLPTKKDQSDPLPWIRLCAILIIAAMLAEVAYLVFGAIRKLMTAAAVLLVAVLLPPQEGRAEVTLNLLAYRSFQSELSELADEVAMRTSIDMKSTPARFVDFDDELSEKPWLWVQRPDAIVAPDGELKPEVINWIKRGGFLVIEGSFNQAQLKKMTDRAFEFGSLQPHWQPIPPDHELMRSFHLLDSLPVCQTEVWRGFHFDGRLAILAIPFQFLESLMDNPRMPTCIKPLDRERSVRVFVNLLMVVLATDYKKDQIHLPEILKRLR